MYRKCKKMQKQKEFDQYRGVRAEFFDDLPVWEDKNTAFIKPEMQNGKNMWLICAADGTRLAATDNRDYAFIVARQNDLNPQSVH